MRLILIRHGQTKSNVQGLIQGQSQNPLSETGIQQARLLSRRLVNEKVDTFYSSDLLRAQQTAEILEESLKHAPIFLPELRERNWGIFEGKPYEDHENALHSSGLLREEFRPQSGESLMDLELRISNSLTELYSKHRGSTVAAVGHLSSNRMIFKLVQRLSFLDWDKIDQDNTCINIFDFHAPLDATIALTNCTEHLNS